MTRFAWLLIAALSVLFAVGLELAPERAESVAPVYALACVGAWLYLTVEGRDRRRR